MPPQKALAKGVGGWGVNATLPGGANYSEWMVCFLVGCGCWRFAVKLPSCHHLPYFRTLLNLFMQGAMSVSIVSNH